MIPTFGRSMMKSMKPINKFAMKKIKIWTGVLYGLWSIIAIVLFALHKVNFWVASAFIWLPLLVAFCALGFVVVAVCIGDGLKLRDKPSCENCLFGRNRNVTGHCIGEAMGAEFGIVCPYHSRDKEQQPE